MNHRWPGEIPGHTLVYDTSWYAGFLLRLLLALMMTQTDPKHAQPLLDGGPVSKKFNIEWVSEWPDQKQLQQQQPESVVIRWRVAVACAFLLHSVSQSVSHCKWSLATANHSSDGGEIIFHIILANPHWMTGTNLLYYFSDRRSQERDRVRETV